MVESEDKETEEPRIRNKKRTQPLSFDRTAHLEVRKSLLCAVFAEAGTGRLNLGHHLSRQ